MTRVSPPAGASRAGKIGLRSILAALASTIGFFGLASITHALTSLVSVPRITHTRSRRGRLAAADFRPSRRRRAQDVGRRRHPRHADRVHRVTAARRSSSGDRQDGHRRLRPRSLGSCVRTRQTANASASVPEHDAADSPLTIEQPDCPNDCYPAIGPPQAACGPAARALKDTFATQASGERGRGLRCPSFTAGIARAP